MFFLKKFISWFLMPVPLMLEFFIVGWLLRRYSRFKKTGTALKGFSVALFLALGCGLGDGYLYNLERRYPPFDPTPEQCEQLRGAVVVVLGQALEADSDLPIRYREGGVFMLRLFEGIRVAKCIPDSHLLVSMAGDATESEKRAFLDEFADTLSFPRGRVSMVTTARDTGEEVTLAYAAIRERVSSAGGGAWPAMVVATSASHIPRSVLLFQKVGMTPIAAPCDYQNHGKQGIFSMLRLRILDGGQLLKAQRTFHEGIGLVYASIFAKKKD